MQTIMFVVIVSITTTPIFCGMYRVGQLPAKYRYFVWLALMAWPVMVGLVGATLASEPNHYETLFTALLPAFMGTCMLFMTHNPAARS